MDQLIIGITHADGLVAEALLKALHQTGMEKESIRLYTAGDGVGNRLAYGDHYLVTDDQTEASFSPCSLVMQLEIDHTLSDKITNDGAILLKQGGDLYFSADDDCYVSPLDYTQNTFELMSSEAYLIIKMLQSIHQSNPVISAQVTVLQPACSLGKAGVDELASQTIELLNARPVEPRIFPVQQAFNLFAENASKDALNWVQQVQSCLGEETESVQIQVMQVPVFYGMTFICTFQCQYALTQEQIKRGFSELTSVQCEDDNDNIVSPVTTLQDDTVVTISQVIVSEQNSKNAQFVMTADHLRHGTAELFLNAMLVIRKTFL